MIIEILAHTIWVIGEREVVVHPCVIGNPLWYYQQYGHSIVGNHSEYFWLLNFASYNNTCFISYQ
jgi:hypothetical protein